MLFKDVLDETTLGRFNTLASSGNYCFGIVTGWRTFVENDKREVQTDSDGYAIEKKKQDNRADNQKIKDILRNHGFGFSEVEGAYPEAIPSGLKLKPGSIIGKEHKYEKSILVFAPEKREKELFDLLFDIGKKFKQDSILFRSHGKEDKARLHFTNTTKDINDGVVTVHNPGEVTDLSTYPKSQFLKVFSSPRLSERKLDPNESPYFTVLKNGRRISFPLE